MLVESKRGEKITRIMADFAFISKQQQQIDLLTKTASERFQQLKIQIPKLLERTPKKYIASYLGITPQSLSRIIKAIP
jgi:CRP-like cAMP-binding protein